MACSAKVLTPLSPAERARFVAANLSPNLFRSVASPEVPDPAKTAWRISPEPFPLKPQTVAAFEVLGADLLKFYRAVNKIYFQSVRGTAPRFIAEYLELGKPEHVVRLQRQNRFKNELPGVIRPDVILTDDGFIASELDSVPGGLGFVGAMGETYCELGYDQIGEFDGIQRGFANMAVSLCNGKQNPLAAIVVSRESNDYRGEMDWLAAAVTATGLADAITVAPENVVFTEEALVVDTPSGRRTVDVLYRFFELFDLLNVPKQELMLYAARHKRVTITAPPKSFLEEKLLFALFHNPALGSIWLQELGADTFGRLMKIFPQTWILDPRPLPPQAAIAGLNVDGRPLQAWNQLYSLSKSERQFVVKPSGFSELAWGSRGVHVANDLTRDEWMAVIDGGLSIFEKSPHIIQRFHKGRRVQVSYLNADSGDVRPMDGRVRLCPYYFVVGDEAPLAGVLATIAPADKRLIHGMSDAVMTTARVSDEGY
ncbi:MAG TPA: hypothetical protein VJN22_01650 [Candidatus Eremiobacteraceae bacterium]|nr:hypothetical protein [Candidatus Eremiobacteraceae bacterium]